MEKYDIIIIGAGPAGFAAAGAACGRGASVLLIDKMKTPGRKLLASGSGRCNITNSEPMQSFCNHYGSAGRFVRPAINAFSPQQTTAFFEKRGLATVEMNDGKIFPDSQNSRDVLAVLEADAGGCSTYYGRAAETVSRDSDFFRICADGVDLFSSSLIITTGGMSYPSTGSDGSGFRLAEMLGHSIVRPEPALTPVYTAESSFFGCSGISIPAGLTVNRGGKRAASGTGDLLFTHDGLSGPLVLDSSRFVRCGDRLVLDLLPEISREDLDALFINRAGSAGTARAAGILHTCGLPARVAGVVFDTAGIPSDRKTAELSRKERREVLRLTKEFPLTAGGKGSFKKAMCTAGGVSRKEVNPSTMESRLVPGLFFAGEVLDVDGDTGGYNIQFALSSGRLAGLSAHF